MADTMAPTSGGQRPQAAAGECAPHKQDNCCDACPSGGCRFCGCRRDRDNCQHVARTEETT